MVCEKNIIFLTGAPASGKTTLGVKLASHLKIPFIDLDSRIVDVEGRTIERIFSDDGEEIFRAIEERELEKLILSTSEKCVIALGGGTLLSEKNRKKVEAHGVVLCLESPSEDELSRRILADGVVRPLGSRSKERAAHYASFSSRIEKVFEVGSSLIVIGNKIANKILDVIKFPIVVDLNVSSLHKNEFKSKIFSFKACEEEKSIESVCKIWKSFFENQLCRSDIVVGVGGGITGDIVGFSASSWMRGINWINVPTTLLSMVDASTGGKTGFNLEDVKNLVGAFHFPLVVIIDVDFLQTLSEEILADGYAEIIKHEIISGKRIISNFNKVPSAEEIAKSLEVKIKIVEEDPLERNGRRILLNCGHTIAHGIEKLSNYSISHGKAVAIGCVAEARLAYKLSLSSKEWVDEVVNRFREANLPTEIPSEFSVDSIIEIISADKKRSKNGEIVFALPCGFGDVRGVSVNLSQKDLFL